MRRFRCGICNAEVQFDDDRCGTCAAALGYLPERCEVRPLEPADGATFRAVGEPTRLWRCLNHAWGCNWMIVADSGDVWCHSCRLTRGRPDTANPDAVDAWSVAERAKRRLVDQLLVLRLPLGGSDGEPPLTFDLLFLPDGAGVTGHRRGVVTLDLREADDSYRDDVRRQLREPTRSVLGHLRHEIGHFYWPLLVERSAALTEFRELFGDEREDYTSALAQHYEAVVEVWSEGHVSHYATAHASEDWAETFAHYLHITDGLETARAHDLSPPVAEPDLAGDLAAWRRVAAGVDQINVGLGLPPAYPFRIGDELERKLTFVDRVLRTTTSGRRSSFG